ncbi:cytochrome c551 [Virgibacillus halotolerans]|uniref:c-type cytochrome n=1 Tax=Virgibacillus halotolerans TaxID=1071053 RepID=UPI001961FFC6|nr:cytochrome c [Virgibacillus halotolerans]MBM7600921.1 cytochrome c551 [Virgibacillus halotolerans]
MKRIGIISGINIILIGCLVFLVFFYEGTGTKPVATADKEETTDSAIDAEDIAKNNCASCHGSDFRGGAGPGLIGLESKYDQAEIEDIIAQGKNGMPGGLISEEEAESVAEWLLEQDS